jgi:hypothetical protein
MEKSVNDRQLHMRILKFTQIGSCVDDDMTSLQKVLSLPTQTRTDFFGAGHSRCVSGPDPAHGPGVAHP